MMMQAEGKSQWKDGLPNFVNNEELKAILNVIITGAKDGVIYLCNDWSEYTDTSIIGDQVAGVYCRSRRHRSIAGAVPEQPPLGNGWFFRVGLDGSCNDY